MVLLLLVFMFSFSYRGFAQTEQFFLEGTVRDASTNEVLPGASVVVKETKKGTPTDISGKYVIRFESSGTYTITASFIGYVDFVTEVKVDTRAKKLQVLNISLNPVITSLSEVTVEAKRVVNTEAPVLLERRKAIAVQDGISIENMVRTASITTTQALQKVTGVSTRDDRSFSVRGLPERNIVVQLNGSRLSSSDPLRSGGVSLDILPAQLLDNIFVKKTLTPDTPGDATAALIELKTRSLPDTLAISAIAQAGWNERVGGPTGSALLFPNAELGFFGEKANRHRLSDEFIKIARAESIPANWFQLGNAQVTSNLYGQIVEGSNSPEAAANALRINQLQEQIDPNLAPVKTPVPINQIYSVAVSNMFKVFGQKRLGALVGLNYYSKADQVTNSVNNRYQLDPNAITPNNVQLTPLLNFREDAGTHAVQYGWMAMLTYKINSTNDVSANYIGNKGAESSGLLLSSIREKDNLFGYQLATSIRTFNTLQLRGEHKPKLFGYSPRVSWVLSGSDTKNELPDFRNSFLLADTSGVVVGGEFKPEYYRVSNLTRFFRNMDESNRNVVLDLTLPILTKKIGLDIKTGVWYLQRERNYNQQLLISPTNFADPNNVDNLFAYIEGLGGGLQKSRGDINKWLTPDVIGISESNSRNGIFVPGYNYTLQTSGNATDGPAAYNALQRVAATYVMADVSVGTQWRITGGMRVEDTDTRATVDSLGVGSNITSVENYLTTFKVDQQEIQWLPSGIVTYRLNPLMNFRVAASKSLGRPEIGELTPIRIYDASQLAYISGNNKLRNAVFTNLDFRWEYFPKVGEVFAASAFYKKINNGLERIFLPTPSSNVMDNTLPLSSVSYRNNPSAGFLFGVELEAVKKLGFLSPRLRNVNVGLNALVARSETRITDKEYYTITQFDRSYATTRPIFEQPNIVLNGNLGYDWPRQQLSANLYFNYTGPRLIEVYADGTPNIYEHPAPQLDFNVSKIFKKHWQVKAFVKNLLDAQTDYIYQKGPEEKKYGVFDQVYYRRQFTKGRTFAVGVSYIF
jgi:TonB-dependent receptor